MDQNHKHLFGRQAGNLGSLHPSGVLVFQEKAMNTVENRFWRKVKKGLGCWEWTACKDSCGYGQFSLNGSNNGAHRVSWEWANGKIPEGLQIDHLCRNPGCVNPKHLEPVTCKENTRRGTNHNRDKTYCNHGHEFTKKNTYIRKRSQGGRTCRICNRDGKLRFNLRRQEDYLT